MRVCKHLWISLEGSQITKQFKIFFKAKLNEIGKERLTFLLCLCVKFHSNVMSQVSSSFKELKRILNLQRRTAELDKRGGKLSSLCKKRFKLQFFSVMKNSCLWSLVIWLCSFLVIGYAIIIKAYFLPVNLFLVKSSEIRKILSLMSSFIII